MPEDVFTMTGSVLRRTYKTAPGLPYNSKEHELKLKYCPNISLKLPQLREIKCFKLTFFPICLKSIGLTTSGRSNGKADSC